MIKTTIQSLFICVPFLFCSLIGKSQQQDEKTQRIVAAYLLAFGQQPRADEIKYWQGQPQNSVSQILELHKTFIKNNGYKREAIINSYKDGLGKMPTEAEISFYSSWNSTYTDLMKNHIAWLTQNSAEYEKMIKSSFVFALRRQPTSTELTVWKNNFQKYSYASMTGYLQTKINLTEPAIPIVGEMSFRLGYSAIEVGRVSATIAQEAKSATGNSSSGVIIAVGIGNISTYNTPGFSSRVANYIVIGATNIF